jgi:hypothetical protein
LPRLTSEALMLDAIFVISTLAFFVLAWAYTHACDRM